MEAAPPPGTPQPGWYPDPEVPGGQRYWDGSQWTENRAPAAQAATAPAGYDPQARQWAMWAHLTGLAGLFIGLNWLGPLIIWAVKKDADPFIKDQATEALNFNLAVFLAGIVCFVLVFVLVGIPLLIALGVGWIVFAIIAATRANRGEAYRYPLTIRFIK
jgi:uncharacterized Tic20 family protein